MARTVAWMLTIWLMAAPAAAQVLDAGMELEVAEAALEEERWDDALAALERAYLADPDPYFLYRRILVLEEMGEYELGLQVLRENRDVLLGSERVNDLVIVEERLESGAAQPFSSPRPNNTVPLVLVGAGSSFLVGGAVLLLGAQSVVARLHDLFEDGMTPLPTREEFERRVRTAETFRTVGGIAVGLGVAGVALGLLTWRTGEDEVSFRIGPSGVTVRGVF